MGDLESLILLLCALYLSECCLIVRRGFVALRLHLPGRGGVAHPTWVGNQLGGLVFNNPLPPLGATFVCGQWPISLSEDAAYAYVAQVINPGLRPDRPNPRLVRFNEIHTIAHDTGTIYVNDLPFIDLGDPNAAAHYAALLTRLWRLPREKRSAGIDAALIESTRTHSIKRRLQQFRLRARWLRVWCHLVFVALLVYLPATIWAPRLRHYWLEFLLVLLFCLINVWMSFYGAHKRLYPEDSVRRWKALTTMLLMPTAAVRACDALGRSLLARYHALAAAAVLCDRAAFADFARRTLLDLEHPLAPACPSEDPEHREIEQSFRRRLRKQLADVATAAGFQPAALTAPPQCDDPACVAFCPRCDTLYVVPGGVCTDCGGIPLMPLPAARPAGKDDAALPELPAPPVH